MVSYEKNEMFSFLIRSIRNYTCLHEFKNEVTNRRGKKTPFLNLKKFHKKRPEQYHRFNQGFSWLVIFETGRDGTACFDVFGGEKIEDGTD